jgi:ABC-2 type transport system ATP-binding protein
VNRDQGKTVILTTHYLEEAEALSDRVAIIDGRRIEALDTPTALIRSLTAASRIEFATAQPVDIHQLKQLRGVVAAATTGNHGYEVRVSVARDALSALLRWAQEQTIELHDLHVVPASLEDVFLSLTGRTIRD